MLETVDGVDVWKRWNMTAVRRHDKKGGKRGETREPHRLAHENLNFVASRKCHRAVPDWALRSAVPKFRPVYLRLCMMQGAATTIYKAPDYVFRVVTNFP
jgi:hypothetical protein